MPETNTMFSRLSPRLGQEALHGRQHGVVAAAGAPADLLVGGVLLAVLAATSVVGTSRRPGKGSTSVIG